MMENLIKRALSFAVISIVGGLCCCGIAYSDQPVSAASPLSDQVAYCAALNKIDLWHFGALEATREIPAAPLSASEKAVAESHAVEHDRMMTCLRNLRDERP